MSTNDIANRMGQGFARERPRSSAADTPEEKLREQLAGYEQKIENDHTLSDAVKDAKIARAYAVARQEMTKLEASAAQEATMATRRATRTAFGSESNDPATFMAQRHAIAEVDKIDPMDRMAPRLAAQLLDQATSLGDESLKQAVALRAHQNGWEEVVQKYAATAKPQQVEALNHLRQPTPVLNPVEMLRYVVPAPARLGAFPSDVSVQRMIESDPASAGVSG
jgi:hypothetical protein